MKGADKKRSSSDSDDECEINKSKKKRKVDDKEERVSQILDQLKKKHSDEFTNFQLRIWSEMIVGGVYTNLDSPPTTSMFNRAGGKKSKKTDALSLSDAVTQISTAITSLSPPAKPPTLPISVSSPVKSIDSRSKCYKQLSELNTLKIAGVLSDDEFYTEKHAIMNILKKL